MGRVTFITHGRKEILILNFSNSSIDELPQSLAIFRIPRSQRYANRLPLEKMFQESILRNKRKRDRKIVEAVEKHGYRQSEIARHLGLHASTVSNLVRNRG